MPQTGTAWMYCCTKLLIPLRHIHGSQSVARYRQHPQNMVVSRTHRVVFQSPSLKLPLFASVSTDSKNADPYFAHLSLSTDFRHVLVLLFPSTSQLMLFHTAHVPQTHCARRTSIHRRVLCRRGANRGRDSRRPVVGMYVLLLRWEGLRMAGTDRSSPLRSPKHLGH